ncbi:choloylglycine hydrolase family protein [Furfurilactobacillus sp. WILCCON 0119]|uniref:choloylglycine hydrolase family protein n=1 Tax=Furfurilactobacillus entadae TaxID=2922307 RepID=UPI0035E6120C
MCTSLTFETTDGLHFLARTMDYAFELGGRPVFLPRGYRWESATKEAEFVNQYAFLGTGRQLGTYFFADGLNEFGLSVAALYFPREAQYQNPDSSKKNLAPHELVSVLLGNCRNLEEVQAELDSIRLVNFETPLINVVPPLHWIVTDASGRCCVIEPTGEKLTLQDNPVEVMTNAPELQWHIKNLNNYVTLQTEAYGNKQFMGVTAHAFGQGTGTVQLPGGYTPPQRFVRTAFLKENIEQPTGEMAGVNAITHILHNVEIPRGVNIKEGVPDYTQYIGIMGVTSKKYYFIPYHNQSVFQIELSDELLQQTEPVEYPFVNDQQVVKLN